MKEIKPGPPRLFSHKAAPYLVLVLSLLFTLAVSYYLASISRSRDQERFRTHANTIADKVQERLSLYVGLLRAGAGLLAVREEVSQKEFRTFVQRLYLQQNYPGSQGMGFAKLVRQENVAEFLAQARRIYPPYVITPPGPRPVYFPILFLEPQDPRNQRALGFDMFSEPVRRRAMLQAALAGETVASGKVTLVQESGDARQAGFLIYAPVYRGGYVPATRREREEKLLGFIFSPFRMDDLLSGIFGRERNRPQITFEIYDGLTPTPDTLLHRSEPGRSAHQPAFTHTNTVMVANHVWTVVSHSSPQFEAGLSRQWAAASALCGVLISFALFAITLRLSRARAQAEESQRLVSEHRERLLVTLGSIGDGVIATDLQNRVAFLNSVAETLTGWSRQEALDRPIHDVFQVVNQAGNTPLTNPVEEALREKKTVASADALELISRQGNRSLIAQSASPIRDLQNHLIGTVLVFHDITERRGNERRLAAQLAATRILSEAGTLEEAAQGILRVVGEHFHWTFGLFLMPDEAQQVLKVVQMWHPPEAALERFAESCRAYEMAPNVGVSGRVWATGQALWLENLAQYNDSPGSAAAREAGLGAVVAIPILHGGHFLGVMEFISRTPGPSQPVLLETLEGIGSQIGQFIERRRAEEALRSSEELHRTIGETAADAIITINAQSEILAVNRAIERIFGYTREEVIGENLTILMPESMRQSHRNGLTRYLATRNKHIPWTGIELPGWHKNGHGIPLEVSFGEVQMAGQHLFVGVIRDITERKLAAERVLEQARVLEKLNEIGRLISAELDLKRLAQSVTDAATQLSGAQWGGLLFRDETDPSGVSSLAASGPAAADFMAALQDRYAPLSAVTLRGEKVEHPVAPPASEEGEREGEREPEPETLEAMTSYLSVPITTRSGQTLGGLFLGHPEPGRFGPAVEQMVMSLASQAAIAFDNAQLFEEAQREIAERKAAEQTVQQLNRDLEQRVEERTAELRETNSQMEAFIYTIAHDLRAPLRAMRGISQALLEDYAQHLDQQAEDYAHRIIRASEFMDSLINDLLDYSRISRSNLPIGPVRLERLLRDSLEENDQELRETNSEVLVETVLPDVRGHISTLRQVFSNLISNAIKFVAPGVRPRLRIFHQDKGDYWRICVEDNGIGIPQEHQERIFGVFERLHGPTYPGTGIGLAIVRKGIERLDGRVGVESVPGQGSLFWFELRKV